MAVNPSISCSYNLEQNSIPIITKTTNENNKTTTIFTNIIQPNIIELIGTTLFILIGLLGACSSSAENNTLIAAFTFGFSLMIFAASLGQISGGHFNPAVTVGVLIAGCIRIKKALLYIFMQLIGGILAAGLFRLLSHTNTYNQCHGGATFLVTMKIRKNFNEYLTDRIHWWEGLCIELLLTFIFVTIILFVTVHQKFKSNFAPIYIGTTLCVCILASNMLTGGSLNPARSLGPAIFANIWSNHYIYWIGPLIGGTLAGIFYRFIWGTNDHDASNN